MEDFGAAMLRANNYGNGGGVAVCEATVNHAHHHKDQMLAAGGTPMSHFMYPTATTTAASSNQTTQKHEATTTAGMGMVGGAGGVIKSDYAAFANCIQQSAMLDQRVDDAHLDGVSLNSVCYVKFNNQAASSLNATLHADLNFKNLSTSNGQQLQELHAREGASSDYSSMLYAKSDEAADIAAKLLASKNCNQAQTLHYLTPAKPLDNTKTNTTTTTANENNAMGLSITSSTNANHKPNVIIPPSSNSLYHSVQQYLIGNEMHHNEPIHSTEQQTVTTTTAVTTSTNLNTANEIHHHSNHNNHNNNSILNTANRSSLHSIEELASSSCLTATTTAANIMPLAAATNSMSKPLTSNKRTTVEELHANYQNLSNVSSDCESLTSEDDEDDDEDDVGYQDNTSSHSQHSGSNGGGSAGGGNAAGNNNSNQASAAGVALLNGVGVGAHSNASGAYMSLLPPSVGGASSSSGHLGSSSVGTCATAVGSAESHGGGGGGGGGQQSSSGGNGIDFKHLFEELCPVCGDKVSGYHYGLLTCESCKGFFKRTVQNKKVYTCVAERSCHIDKTQRKRCPFCRFQKCLEVGMKLEAVRADRMRGGRNKFGPMYKRDRARKLQIMRQRQLALQALRTSMGSADMKATPLSPGYQQAYPNMNIKQEIQIPQVSSLTQSPDSSPSPIAIALGQVNASTSVIATAMNGGNVGTGSGGGSNGGAHLGNNNSNNNSDGCNRGGGGNGNCHDGGTGSLHNASESKLCFDSGTHPSSTADSLIEPLRVSPMIRDFVQSIDDREWQTQLFALLQKQTYNQVEVDLFELMCKVLDQNLFSQVDWARNTVFFKDLKVDDQMKLLQHSWSDMLVLDHLHQRIHNGLPDETQLNNGQVFNLLGLGLLGVPQLSDYFNELQNRLQDLKFDMGDYVCMKFLILLNPDVRGIINKKTVLEGHENVQAALLDYTLTCYPSVTDKFRRLLNILPDIHAMAGRGEEHLYSKHCAGNAPTQTLLMEMLHAKRKV